MADLNENFFLQRMKRLEQFRLTTELRNQDLLDAFGKAELNKEPDNRQTPKNDPEVRARDYCNRVVSEINEYRERMERPLLALWTKESFRAWEPEHRRQV